MIVPLEILTFEQLVIRTKDQWFVERAADNAEYEITATLEVPLLFDVVARKRPGVNDWTISIIYANIKGEFHLIQGDGSSVAELLEFIRCRILTGTVNAAIHEQLAQRATNCYTEH